MNQMALSSCRKKQGRTDSMTKRRSQSPAMEKNRGDRIMSFLNEIRSLAFPSFPSCTWERFLIFAKFHFARAQLDIIASRSAMKLPQQVRSQVQLGNEGKRGKRLGAFNAIPKETSAKVLALALLHPEEM